jgi:hypothetical protein
MNNEIVNLLMEVFPFIGLSVALLISFFFLNHKINKTFLELFGKVYRLEKNINKLQKFVQEEEEILNFIKDDTEDDVPSDFVADIVKAQRKDK